MQEMSNTKIISDFDNFFALNPEKGNSKDFPVFLFEVVTTGVLLGHSMSLAVIFSTAALIPPKPNILFAIKTTLRIDCSNLLITGRILVTALLIVEGVDFYDAFLVPAISALAAVAVHEVAYKNVEANVANFRFRCLVLSKDL